MDGFLFEKLSILGSDGALFIISMIPVIELRGSVILGAALSLPWWEVYIISVLGNMVPMPFVMMLGRHIIQWLKLLRPLTGFITKLEAKLQVQAGHMKGRIIGLIAFVSVPIPGTGGWTGSLLAAITGLPLRKALPAVCCGIIISGAIMTMGAYGVVGAFQAFVA